MLKRVSKFCYMGDTVGAGGGVKASLEAARATVSVLELSSRSYLTF